MDGDRPQRHLALRFPLAHPARAVEALGWRFAYFGDFHVRTNYSIDSYIQERVCSSSIW